MSQPLADLDELVLKCRDERAKSYIAEAVACYKVGAFRSSVVACWIAVCFDVIDKLRELALAGDAEAEKKIEELKSIRASNDLKCSLEFERTLLEVARDKFELLSHLECQDLERLREDRNRCAHPSMVSEENPFSPPGELARLHIRSAVHHLLQHQPVQGKYALERLMVEIDSDYFPTNKKAALVAFSSGPLKRPRDSLVRNLVVILLKRLFNEPIEGKAEYRADAALQAIRDMHQALTDKAIAENLSKILRALKDSDLHRTLRLAESMQYAWPLMDEDVRLRIENFVRDLPTEHFGLVENLFDFTGLSSQAKQRVLKMTAGDLVGAYFFITPPEVANRMIANYLNSSSFDDANAWGKRIVAYAVDLSGDQVKQILEGIQKNGQVLDSFELGAVINWLRSTKKIPVGDFELLLQTNGLKHQMLSDIPF